MLKKPYFFESKKYDSESSSYVDDKERVWVWNIYKKDLVALGVEIIRSELGGKIGHYATTDWCFLIRIEDKAKITEAICMSNHPRACPECGKIIEWTKTPKRKTLPNSETVTVQQYSLECPEHGPFDNISSRVNTEMTRVIAELK